MGTELPSNEDGIPHQGILPRLSRIFVLLPLFLVPQPSISSQNAVASAPGANTGTISNLHSDKHVVQSGRWFLVREFTIEFAVHGAQQTYCGELSTTDATEAHDLMDSGGKLVEVAERGRDLEVKLENGRRVRAHRLSPDRCPRS
jgi:hypothetical protein